MRRWGDSCGDYVRCEDTGRLWHRQPDGRVYMHVDGVDGRTGFVKRVTTRSFDLAWARARDVDVEAERN